MQKTERVPIPMGPATQNLFRLWSKKSSNRPCRTSLEPVGRHRLQHRRSHPLPRFSVDPLIGPLLRALERPADSIRPGQFRSGFYFIRIIPQLLPSHTRISALKDLQGLSRATRRVRSSPSTRYYTPSHSTSRYTFPLSIPPPTQSGYPISPYPSSSFPHQRLSPRFLPQSTKHIRRSTTALPPALTGQRKTHPFQDILKRDQA